MSRQAPVALLHQAEVVGRPGRATTRHRAVGRSGISGRVGDRRARDRARRLDQGQQRLGLGRPRAVGLGPDERRWFGAVAGGSLRAAGSASPPSSHALRRRWARRPIWKSPASSHGAVAQGHARSAACAAPQPADTAGTAPPRSPPCASARKSSGSEWRPEGQQGLQDLDRPRRRLISAKRPGSPSAVWATAAGPRPSAIAQASGVLEALSPGSPRRSGRSRPVGSQRTCRQKDQAGERIERQAPGPGQPGELQEQRTHRPLLARPRPPL